MITTEGRVFMHKWLSARIPIPASSDFRAIGWLNKERALTCVVGYNGFHGATCQMHVAAEGRNWMAREHLWATFHYPFVQLNLLWLVGVVGANNYASLKLTKNLGFKEFASIPQGFSEEEDLILLRCHRDSPRVQKWLSLGERYGWESKSASYA